MKQRIHSVISAILLILLYLFWPVDLLPASLLDDFVVAVAIAAFEIVKQIRFKPSVVAETP